MRSIKGRKLGCDGLMMEKEIQNSFMLLLMVKGKFANQQDRKRQQNVDWEQRRVGREAINYIKK